MSDLYWQRKVQKKTKQENLEGLLVKSSSKRTKGTRRACASEQSCKILLRVIIIIIVLFVIVAGENKVKSYFVGFAQ